jgi:hypothetical protein
VLLDDFGFDAAIDYKQGNLLADIAKSCPDGVDVFFDNVGGAILDAGLMYLALHGRIVICGAIATYNDETPAAGPKQYLRLLTRRARMEGFLFFDYMSRAAEGISAISAWLRAGRLSDRVDVVDGFENAPTALQRLFTGENHGKQLVKIAEPTT